MRARRRKGTERIVTLKASCASRSVLPPFWMSAQKVVLYRLLMCARCGGGNDRLKNEHRRKQNYQREGTTHYQPASMKSSRAPRADWGT